jgi:hypothetical protein
MLLNCYRGQATRIAKNSTGASTIIAADLDLKLITLELWRLPVHVECLCTLSKEES